MFKFCVFGNKQFRFFFFNFYFLPLCRACSRGNLERSGRRSPRGGGRACQGLAAPSRGAGLCPRAGFSVCRVFSFTTPSRAGGCTANTLRGGQAAAPRPGGRAEQAQRAAPGMPVFCEDLLCAGPCTGQQSPLATRLPQGHAGSPLIPGREPAREGENRGGRVPDSRSNLTASDLENHFPSSCLRCQRAIKWGPSFLPGRLPGDWHRSGAHGHMAGWHLADPPGRLLGRLLWTSGS